MADGKITIETSIDNAGALKDLNKLINEVNSRGKKAADSNTRIFSRIGSGIGKSVGAGVKVAATAIGGVTTLMAGAGAAAVRTGIDFESAFAGVKKTVDAPKEVLDGLRQSLIDMSKEMPQSASELANIAEAAGQLGIETDNIGSFTRTMAQLGDATNMVSTQAADSLARFANITGMSQTNFDRLGSTIVALGNNLATTESEITDMGMRLAGAGHQVGMSEAQIMSFSAALSSVGIEAEAGGSAFSTVMSQMQLATEKGGESLDNFAEVAGMSADEFKAAFQEDAASAIIAFIQGLANCEDQGKSAIGILDDMGITEIRQRDALLRAAGASDVFTKALDIGTQAWDENTALANEASQRYETLDSKISMMKNSASALGIQFKDSIDGELRNAVQAGTDSIHRLSDAFTTGGLEEAVAVAGDVIADLTVRIAQSAPEMIESASTLLQSFVRGVSSRRGEILNAGVDIAKALATGVADMLPSSMSKPAKEAINTLAKSLNSGGLKDAAGDVVNIFKNMATLASKALKPAAEIIDVLADNFDTLAPIAAGAYTAISGKGKIDTAINSIKSLVDGVKKMTDWYKKAKIVTAEYALQEEIATYTGRKRTVEMTAGQAIVGLFTGKVKLATAAQTIWNAVTAANPIGLLLTAVAAAAATIGVFALTSQNSASAVKEESDALKENADKIRETQQARQESIDGINQEYGHYEQLWQELKENVDQNGKVKQGYEDRAAFITSALSDALGVEITMTDGVIDKYDELQDTIDETIEKKKQQAMLDAYEDSYSEAIKNQADANKKLVSSYEELQEAQKNYNAVLDEYSGMSGPKADGARSAANSKLKDAETAYKNAKVAADEYNNTIVNYESASGAVVSGSENANSALQLLTENMKTASTATTEELQKQVESYQSEFESMKAAAAEGGAGVTQQMVSDAQQAYLLAYEQWLIGRGLTEEAVRTSLASLAEEIGASGIPEAAGTEATETTAAAAANLTAGTPAVQSSSEQMMEGAKQPIVNAALSEAARTAASGTGTAIQNTMTAETPQAVQGVFGLIKFTRDKFAAANLPQAAQNAGSGTGTALGNSISSGSGNASSGASSLIAKTKNSISGADLAPAAKKTGQSAGTGLVNGLSAQTGNAGKSASNLVNAVKKGVSSANLNNHCLNEGKQAGQALANGLRSGAGVVASAAKALATSAKSAVSGMRGAGSSAGAQFSAGLASGIRSGAGGVKAAAADVARQAADAAKANLQIKSPSRVMEKVGYWYDRGLGGGIKKYADTVMREVDQLAASLIISPQEMARSAQTAFDTNIRRVAERYASAQNRIPGESSAELDLERLATLFADRVIARLGELGITVNEREFARLVREVDRQ